MEESKDVVYLKSEFSNKESLEIVRGHNFSKSNDIDEIINSLAFNGV